MQWLCNADRSDANPYRRLLTFFTSLYRSLVRGGRAVLQWYPENTQQMELVTSCAMRCGFSGGLLVDYPNSTRAKKYFLVIYAGQREGQVSTLSPATRMQKLARSLAYIKTRLTVIKPGRETLPA